jgi:hypothetical protein
MNWFHNSMNVFCVCGHFIGSTYEPMASAAPGGGFVVAVTAAAAVPVVALAG